MNMAKNNTKKKDIENYFSYTMYASQLEEENRILRETINHLKQELERFKAPALLLAEVSQILGERAIIRLPNGNSFLVNIAPNIKDLRPGDSVFVEQKNLSIVERAPKVKSFDVERFVIIEKPNVPWRNIGGLKEQIREIREVVELPLKKPELFRRVGIEPPKGVLLYGPPGTGKTLLAKAVATSTHATFIEIVASELVQKFIGEGAKLVKEVFQLARERAPSIVFIDEIDALAAKRIEIGTSGEREVQRTFMQLLAEIDGFKSLGNVKVIAATNRPDILDPAITRPGRLDRLIEVPLPDRDARLEILKIHTRKMNLAKNIKLEKLADLTKGMSGADLKAVCTEAGYYAIRANRYSVKLEDFLKAIRKVKKEEEDTSYKSMFG
ncbi:proteasome-activating nucleotidase [Candidatus Woesearchaeota archaeon]|nr:proteasome-activating nucleotidase [Candidatus Woesearchaeota archaeon]